MLGTDKEVASPLTSPGQQYIVCNADVGKAATATAGNGFVLDIFTRLMGLSLTTFLYAEQDRM